MHGCCGEPPNVVQEMLLGVVGEVMGFDDGEVGSDSGINFGAQSVADPADV
jgi:hypothetical protein